MAAKVYTFHITYEGLDEKIWRRVEVSSNYRLDQLGYMVLAAFDTLACHLFEFNYDGTLYELPDPDGYMPQHDMGAFRLHQLGLTPGKRLQMDYDLGTTQTFWLELTEIADMKPGWGKHYPYLLEGAGRGIVDDVSAETLAEWVAQIDQKGKTDKPIYYHERITPWDYRWFDLDIMNDLLKVIIKEIEAGYAPFWQND